MKHKLLITGIGMLVYGLIRVFYYFLTVSIGTTLLNKPFPFEHLAKAVPSDRKGTRIEINYIPLEEAVNDPYWFSGHLYCIVGLQQLFMQL